MSNKNKKSFYHMCRNLVGSSYNKILWCCVFAFLATIFSLSNYMFEAFYGINKALASKELSKIIFAATIIAILGLLNILFFHIMYRIALKITKNIALELRERVFKKTIYLDTEYYNTHASGAMLNTIIYDVATFAEGMSWSLPTILRQMVNVFISFIIVTIMNPKLSAILWIVSPIVAVIATLIFKKIGKLYDKRRVKLN